MKRFENNTVIAWIITGITFLIHFLPYFILGQNSYIRIHDTLEGEWIWLHILNQTDLQYTVEPYKTIPQIMNFIPREVFPSAMNVMHIWIDIFGTFWGYVFNYLLIHSIAFLSMYITILRLFPKSLSKSIAIYVSLIFSLIPFYTPFGVSVAIQPILFYLFYNAYHQKIKWYYFIIVILIPFYSSIVWLGIPSLMIIGIVSIYQLMKTKKMNWKLYVLSFVFAFSFALCNYTIVQLMMNSSFISHRSVYNLYMIETPQIINSIIDFTHQLFTIHYHVGTMLTLPILLLLLLIYKDLKSKTSLKYVLIAMGFILLFQSLYQYIEYYNQLEVVRSFRFNRLHIFLPFLWMLILIFCLNHIWNHQILKKIFYPFVISMVMITGIGNDEILHNYLQLTKLDHMPNFKEYMAEKQFAEIKKSINLNELKIRDNGKSESVYKVVSLGLSPTIAQYNGFYTLDGLQSNYDLNYKYEFQKIIQPELDKSNVLKQYFEGWGNRCYLFSSELGKEWDATLPKRNEVRKINLTINSKQLLNISNTKFVYIISSVEIINPQENNLMLLEVFTHPESWWTIYLYEVYESKL